MCAPFLATQFHRINTAHHPIQKKRLPVSYAARQCTADARLNRSRHEVEPSREENNYHIIKNVLQSAEVRKRVTLCESRTEFGIRNDDDVPAERDRAQYDLLVADLEESSDIHRKLEEVA